MKKRPLLAVLVALAAFALQGHMNSYKAVASLSPATYSEAMQ